MFKYFSLFIIFLFLTGGICAVGKKATTTTRCIVKQERKSIKIQQPSRDVFKTKYWIISAIFRQ